MTFTESDGLCVCVLMIRVVCAGCVCDDLTLNRTVYEAFSPATRTALSPGGASARCRHLSLSYKTARVILLLL